MTPKKTTNILDLPLAAREAIFAQRLKEAMEETGIQLGIATLDSKTKYPTLADEIVAAPKKKVQKTKN